MKLNYKRTILVGFAFFLICTFWQAYDTIIPKILTDKFGMSQANSGIIMALDNILALFMLPLFGAISDKCQSRLGRRTPFILIGTLVAAAALFTLSFADGMQLKNIEAISNGVLPQQETTPAKAAAPATSVEEAVRSIENSIARIQPEPPVNIDIDPAVDAPAAKPAKSFDSTQPFTL